MLNDPAERYEWFCLRSQPKREHIAAAMLARIGNIDVFCPRISQLKMTRNGKKRFVEALFPSYLFAKFSPIQHYRQVIHTAGITGIVGRGNQRAVPNATIEALKISLPEDIIEAPDFSIQPGAAIEFVSGSLQGLEGTVLAQMSSNNRVQVLLEFLGREIKVIAYADDILLAKV
jgi:transcriptional antiterminator RfaH